VRRVTVAVEGPALLVGLEVVDTQALELAPTETRTFAVRVRAASGPGRGAQPIVFVISTEGGEGNAFTLREKSRFLLP